MLSRRFAAACCLTTLAGLVAAIVVAEGSRPARSWEVGQVVACVADEGVTCLPPKNTDEERTTKTKEPR